jgi:hypothetical protein
MHPSLLLDSGSPFSDARPEHRPLRGYSVLTSVFIAAFAGSVAAAYRRRGELPEHYEPMDLILAGIATHKVSRLITKAKVTGTVRAPFVEHKGPAGHGEVDETARGTGLRRAVGELLTCPHCISQWVAGAIGVGMVAAPRLTRLVTFVYSVEAVSDFLQLAYVAAGDEAES